MRALVAAAMVLGMTCFPASARHHHHVRHYRHVRGIESGEIISHPDGCPHSAFCGCGASVRIFGHSIRSLWTAANWFHFPRTQPAPGMAAVRRHHVFVLEYEVQKGRWMAYDANSGRHQTRMHVRSLAGYTIVNPHG